MNVIQLTKKIPHFHFKEIAARMSNVEMKLGCQTRFSLGQVDVLQIVYLHEILLQGKDHTVWQALLGFKKITVVETLSILKFRLNPTEICKN